MDVDRRWRYNSDMYDFNQIINVYAIFQLTHFMCRPLYGSHTKSDIIVVLAGSYSRYLSFQRNLFQVKNNNSRSGSRLLATVAAMHRCWVFLKRKIKCQRTVKFVKNKILCVRHKRVMVDVWFLNIIIAIFGMWVRDTDLIFMKYLLVRLNVIEL